MANTTRQIHGDSDGWLLVRMDDARIESLPQSLNVRFIETKDRRDYFEILEGVHKGKKASVSRSTTGSSYLFKPVPHLPGAHVRFNRARQEIRYASEGPFSAFTGAFSDSDHTYTAVPIGRYSLLIPDAPHSATRTAYYSYTKYHKTWFPIGGAPSRFLHVGEISEGCVTVRAFNYNPAAAAPAGFEDLPALPKGAVGLPYAAKLPPVASWDRFYNHLINHRQDDRSVGTLEVS